MSSSPVDNVVIRLEICLGDDGGSPCGSRIASTWPSGRDLAGGRTDGRTDGADGSRFVYETDERGSVGSVAILVRDAVRTGVNLAVGCSPLADRPTGSHVPPDGVIRGGPMDGDGGAAYPQLGRHNVTWTARGRRGRVAEIKQAQSRVRQNVGSASRRR